MEEILFYLEILSQDMFTAFGIFSLIYLTFNILFKNEKFKEFDSKARNSIIYIGILFMLVWIIRTFHMYFQETGESKQQLKELMFGKYFEQFWTQPIIWFILTQLYRIRKISNNYIFRILSSFGLIVSINKFTLFLSVFHRDYLPSSWTMYSGLDIYPSNIILENLLKLLIFIGCVFIIDKIKCKLNKKTTVNIG